MRHVGYAVKHYLKYYQFVLSFLVVFVLTEIKPVVVIISEEYK